MLNAVVFEEFYYIGPAPVSHRRAPCKDSVSTCESFVGTDQIETPRNLRSVSGRTGVFSDHFVDAVMLCTFVAHDTSYEEM